MGRAHEIKRSQIVLRSTRLWALSVGEDHPQKRSFTKGERQEEETEWRSTKERGGISKDTLHVSL